MLFDCILACTISNIMKKSYILISILYFATTLHLSAQSNFRKGFIITHDNKIVYGEIEDQTGFGNYESCRFREGDNVIKELTPEQIAGYRFLKDNKYYASKINIFVEILIDGKASLYKYRDYFYIKNSNDNVVHRLDNEKIDEQDWKYILKHYFLSCKVQPRDIDRMNYSQKKLVDFVLQYNKCSGNDYVKYDEKYRPPLQLEYGLLMGFNQSKISVENPKNKYRHMAEAYESKNPSFGMFLDLSSPKNIKYLSVQQEIHFTKSYYSSLVVLEINNVTDHHDVFFNYSTISLPLSLKYTLPIKEFSLFAQAGLMYEQNINRRTKLITESVKNDLVTTSESTPFNISKSQSGYCAGVGVMKSFKLYQVGLNLKISEVNKLNSDD